MSNDEETTPLTVDMKLDQILARLTALEAKAYDTKPIWERALAEILEVKDRVSRLDARLGALNKRWLDFEAELSMTEDRIDKIEHHIGKEL